MNHLGLFEGIGGFGIAAEEMGWNTLAWCENNLFCKEILKKRFPNAIGHDDIKGTDFTIHRGTIDILTGGFPCQPYSVAGKKKGKEDDRFLWPEYARAAKETRTPWIVGENVPGIVDDEYSMFTIKNDLTSQGYKLLPIQIPASLVGANHLRKRIFFVAYSDSYGMERRRIRSNISKNRQRGESCQANMFNQKEFTLGYSSESESELIRADDGIQNWKHRVNALGNAVVPQVVYQIFKTIQDYEDTFQGTTLTLR